jgi:uncharacterized membrane protein
MYSKLKLFGHPIHPMLVAYPIAFYTSTLVAFLLYGLTADAFWVLVAIAANAAGVLMAVVAAVPGFIDWLVGIPSGTAAKRTGLIHLSLNVAALVVFAITLFSFLRRWDDPQNATALLGILPSIVGVGLTVAAGFQGWKLIQDHHVGVKLSREQERMEPGAGERVA